jgi:Fe-S cluster assembly ATP-binding protein
MLKINNLCVKVEKKTILDNINLKFEQGKIYVISGQNGSGKSTLAQIIAGNPEYKVEPNSQLTYTPVETTSVSPKNDKAIDLKIPPVKEIVTKLTGNNNLEGGRINLTNLTPEQRSNLGIFVSMQYPTEIPGVNLLDFLKIIISNNRRVKNLDKLTTKQTLDLIDSKLEKIGWNKDFLKRNVNEGMSGGERKKCEILQMLLLDPQLIVLDEIDSGLDKEALELVVKVVLEFMSKDKTLIIITHQQKILDLIKSYKIIRIEAGKIVLDNDFKIST